jgi:hypothetical protein
MFRNLQKKLRDCCEKEVLLCTAQTNNNLLCEEAFVFSENRMIAKDKLECLKY